MPALATGGVQRWLTDLLIGWQGMFAATVLIVGKLGKGDWRAVQEIAPLAPVIRLPPEELDSWLRANRVHAVIMLGIAEFSMAIRQWTGKLFVAVQSQRGRSVKQYIRANQERAAFVVGASKATLPIMQSVAESKRRIIYNGVAPERLVPIRPRAELRAVLGIDPTEFVVGYVGRVAPGKGLRVMVEAVKMLGGGYHLLVCGDGPLLGRLGQLARQAGIRATFLPYTAHVAEVYAAMDLFCGGSAHEGFWLAAVEAALAGVPLVAPPVGILAEIKAEGGDLWEVPAGITPDGLAAAIGRVRAKPNQALKARLKRYTARAAADEWARLIWKSFGGCGS